jgi:hypothetical protein
MKNGSLQNLVTVVTAAFVIGTIWNRISSNAASMRASIEEVKVEQHELREMIESLIKK